MPPVAPRGLVPAAASVWCEAGINLSALVLPSLLALVPHGAAPLVGFAGLCAVGLVAANPPDELTALRRPAAILGALVVWGAVSAAWSIAPWRSLLIALRLTGLFAAVLALAAAASRLTAPWRLALCLFTGTAIGIALALYDLASAGALTRYVSIRPFGAPRLNQIAAWLTLFILPATTLLICRGRRLLALGAAAAMAATVYALDDTTAKIALALALPAAALVYLSRAAIARSAAVLAMLAVLTAPLTLPRLAHLPSVFASVDAFKDSAGHRLLIWSFTGDHITERPFLGWGLDSARAIPGGKVEIRPGQTWLPLHPHDAALQLWLELGAPGAALFALLLGLLWLRLAAAPWPRVYAAGAGGSLTAAFAIALSAWGIWEEWWLATLSLALFATIVMARTAAPASGSAAGATPLPRGLRAADR